MNRKEALNWCVDKYLQWPVSDTYYYAPSGWEWNKHFDQIILSKGIDSLVITEQDWLEAKADKPANPWVPQVGKECELSNRGCAFEIATIKYIGDTYLIAEHDYGEQHYYMGCVVFRPLRTQEDAEREELFSECVGALQFIPQCEEVNAHHKDAIEWLIDSGLIVKR